MCYEWSIDFLEKILDFGKESEGKGASLQSANVDWDVETNQWLIGDKPIQPNKPHEAVYTIKYNY